MRVNFQWLQQINKIKMMNSVFLFCYINGCLGRLSLNKEKIKTSPWWKLAWLGPHFSNWFPTKSISLCICLCFLIRVGNRCLSQIPKDRRQRMKFSLPLSLASLQKSTLWGAIFPTSQAEYLNFQLPRSNPHPPNNSSFFGHWCSHM